VGGERLGAILYARYSKRSDNGSEFTARAVREWLGRLGVRTLFIVSAGSPWENGNVESFHGKLRDELLDREIFDTVMEARVLVDRWSGEYNHIRPHSSLGYRPRRLGRLSLGLAARLRLASMPRLSMRH
jgi:transposase InsO family protein